MIHYPIVIPTLNRYEHFKRCVESLARCTGADETELVIGLDYPPADKYVAGYKQIKEYIPAITGFKKVTCFEHKENFGAYNNSIFLREYASKHYDAYIYTEDDNEFSPCFLEFMNKGLEMYKDDPKVQTVGGYTPECLYGKSDDQLIFSFETCAWGFGLWFEKEMVFQKVPYSFYESVLQSSKKSLKIFCNFPMLLGMLISMVRNKTRYGDVMRCTYNLFNDSYMVRPSISMSRNWGYDGSGVHCGGSENDDNPLSRQRIVERTTVDFNYQKPKEYKKIRRSFFFYGTSQNKLKAIKQIVWVALVYVKYRLSLHN